MNRLTHLRMSLVLVAVAAILFLPVTVLAAEAEPSDVDEAEASSEEAEAEANVEESETEEVTMEDMRADDDATYDSDEGSSSRDNAGDWAWTITQSAFWGGVTGALIGVGLLLVGGDRFDGVIIARLAGGGILVGAGLGIISVLTRGSGSNPNMELPASIEWMERDLPQTYDIGIELKW